MNTLSQTSIIGIDVSRDWLDIHCLEDGKRLRFANTLAGHKKVTKLALERKALVCFEATGGQEWQLWASLDEAGIITRQLPPEQIKAFAASCGTRAKTDAIDAELIARFMAFRPQAGRQLPYKKLRLLRALTTKRSQLVEARKRLLAQIKACEKQVHTPLFITMDTELRLCLNKQISELESQIKTPSIQCIIGTNIHNLAVSTRRWPCNKCNACGRNARAWTNLC